LSAIVKKILVGYDDGILAQKALAAAEKIALDNKAELFIATAVELPTHIATYDIYMQGSASLTEFFNNHANAYYQKILEQAALQAKEKGLDVTIELLEGSPGKALLKYAEEVGADLIVVGSNNKKPLDRLFLGSVSTYVLHHAKGMILIVKE
jgi:nucleotide-binding universal stress UspA family protein